MRARLVPSRRLALVFVLALGALLWAVLLGASARVPLRTPFVPRAARANPVTIPLEGREARGGALFRAELAVADVAALLDHEELQLFFEGDAKPPSLVGGEVRIRGRGCTLVAAARGELTARRPTSFRRSSACASPRAAAGPATLDLVLEVQGQGGVSILAFEPLADAQPAPLRLVPTRARPTPLDVRGAFVDYPETAPRIVLLGYMWRNAPGPAEILGLVALATALACAGCLVFPTRPLTPGAPASGAVVRGSCGGALFALSLTLLHAVIAPPLSGPDEPYHLLGFADLVEDHALAQDTVHWMAETHLWRIRQQPSERFRTIDVGRPYVGEDDQLRPTEVAMRSAILARLWRVARPLAEGEPAPRALLALRLVNAFVFALAVGAAAALALVLVAEPFRQWLVFPFLFVPALPFFAMHVSETALLASVYVVLGAGFGVTCLDGPRAHWAGLPLGLATGLMLAGGRSPWPLVPLVAALLLGRAALGGPGPRRGAREALVFWTGFGVGASVLFLAQDGAYRTMTETYATYVARSVPTGLRRLGLWLLAHPAGVAGLALLGAAAEVALGPLRERLATLIGPAAQRIVGRGAAVLAVAVLASLLASLFVAFPQLPLERQYDLTPSDRVNGVLRTMATMFRLTAPDYQLASSFWVGFGWLDTMPKPPFQGLLMALVGLALVVQLAHVARHRQVRRFLWLGVTATGAIAALVLYTLSTQGLVTSLTGRYLIGWYLAVLAVIAGGLVLEHGAPGQGADTLRPGSTRAALLLAVAGSVHVYCLSVILQRYF